LGVNDKFIVYIDYTYLNFAIITILTTLVVHITWHNALHIDELINL